MVDDLGRRAAGWEAIPLTPDTARIYGLPEGTSAFRKLVHDGVLVAILSRDSNGHALALSHVAHYDADVAIAGRFPTWAEVYGARRMLLPDDALMVAVLEPMSYALRLRWERVHSQTMLPQAPGLATTVKCVQMYCEGVTEDCVFGTQDIVAPPPPPRPTTPPFEPIGPVPDELLGDAELAALEDEDEPDPEEPL